MLVTLQLVHTSRIERERLAQLGEIVALQLITLDEYRASHGRGHSDRIFARVDQMLRMLRWHVDIRAWEDPALSRYRDGLAELADNLAPARDAARDSRPSPSHWVTRPWTWSRSCPTWP